MAVPKSTKKNAAKKTQAKESQTSVDTVELARHYAQTCCSIDYEALLVIEAQYSTFVLED